MKDRPSRILAVVVGAVVVLALLVVWLSTSRSRPEFAAGSPERTVQSYLVAVTRHDAVEAARHLDPASGCEVSDIEQSGFPEGVRVTLVGSTVTGPEARVTVLITSDVAPIGGAGTSETHLFRLTRPGQEWLISGTPWPLYVCEGVQK
ncbi:MAG TPA: hypothetical protein VFN43_05955 [Humibacillus sp.]|nr:hypothetical protein [Humibacillus sp.]